MLDDIIYEHTGRISGHSLDVEVPTLKITLTNNSIIDSIDVTEIVTYYSKSSSQLPQDNEKIFYAKGQDMITSKDRIDKNMEMETI